MKKIITQLLSLVLLGAFIPSFVLAKDWDLNNGSITVNAVPGTDQTVTQGNNTQNDNNPVITSSGKTENTVTIKAEENATANVTLENVNIDVSSKSEAAITTSGEGNVNIELDGTNTVQSGTYHAGVEKANDGTLTIADTNQYNGSLTATGGQGGAGIGGGVFSDSNGNNITVSGGTITATGGEHSAGIGGGGSNSGNNNASNITISGGNVTANGAGDAAGIGGGNGGSGTGIEITGGKVTATGGEEAAGIGGGKYGNGSGITVSGGGVIATGKSNLDGGGAGIGGGSSGSGSDITVSNGTVNATGGNYSAGIGGGKDGSGSDITVSGGEVTAKGGGFGAGIGGGINGDGSGITVSGGKVNATGDPYGAGIGGGQSGNGKNILISDGEVTANSNAYGAGIGGGWKGEGDTITVSGGKVTANGGFGGAGIGGGENASGTNIAISGGEVTAQGGKNGAGIGGGQSSNGSGITISGNAQVKAQGGAEYRGLKEGAAIGNGGTDTQKGDELDMDQVASGLSVDGFIQTYKPGDNMDIATPEKSTIGTTGEHSWDEGKVTIPATCTTPGEMTYTCTNTAHTSPITKTEPIPALKHDFKTYIYDKNATCEADGTETAKCERCNVTDTRTAKGTKLPGSTAEAAPERPAEAYWVSGPDGQSLPYQAQTKDGVLTLTVQADTASLRGSTESLRQLEAQGITEIRFITNGAESAFTLSALRTSGTGSFTLTHEGKAVTFTLAEKDISGILK